ncbi:hypothetical protein [Gordonia rhizosphera]|uniref:Uncharacterized protein n=1 Tax=Gordonia rhizosphera NBRC 16068 TaxID=1108045 RepID=K6V4X9_9ACTN|nr:hypothetical protein [Gordonia rhizosphera]GAB91243.1 hypothetical protein GORHZ_125_01270 [Gordonia rhizosphera NBRC 16068]
MDRVPESISVSSRQRPHSGAGHRRTAAVIAALLVVGAAQLTTFTAPANAAPAATVMVKTQRMSAPTLKSRQEGWYQKGQRLTLKCHKRGQAVRGYFSSNIPNGGWDNLWYQTSDNGYIADVDIETHTLNALGPECGRTTPAPAPAPGNSSKANAAVLRANSAVGTDMFGDIGCGKFVAWAYGRNALGFNTAKEFRDSLFSQNKIHMDRNFPRGALVFSQSSWDRGMGHVDIARGDGTFVSGGVSKTYHGLAGGGHNVQVLSRWNPAQGATYLGWAYAPW